MHLSRSMLVALILVVLGGCGLGGTTPSATTKPSTGSNATTKPEATEKAEATTKPATTKPKATEKPSSAGGAIPAPPDSESYVKGSDPTIDVILTTVEQEINNSGDINFTDTEFYLSTAKLDDLEDFYKEEMPNAGWDGTPEIQDQDGGLGKVLGFPNADETEVAIIGAFDLTAAGQEGLIIMTTVGKQKAGGSDTKPTTKPTTGGGASEGLGDIPEPPKSEVYQDGDNQFIDIFVTSFTTSVEGGFEGSGVTKTGQEEFTSTASAEDIKAFYNDEMEALGWETLEATPNNTAQILNYTRTEGGKSEVAVITSVNLEDISAGEGSLVIILVAAEE